MKFHRYTIRNVPASLDAKLRQKAQRKGQSLNQVLLDTLAENLRSNKNATRYHDLDALAGSWIEDKVFDNALRFFSETDSDDWI